MNSREYFRATMHFEQCGHLSWHEAVPDEEAGINGIWSLEVAAGMDAVSLRKEYGRRLILAGNIDKRIVASGDKNAIKHEVESKVGFLKEGGGYIVSLDYLVPPDTPLEAFRHYVDVLAKYL